MNGASPRSLFCDEGRQAFRKAMRRFVEREIAPHVDAGDEAETFPGELYKKAAEIGLLGLGFPEDYGGGASAPPRGATGKVLKFELRSQFISAPGP